MTRLDPFYLILSDATRLAALVPPSRRLVQLRFKDLPDPVLRRQIAEAKATCGRDAVKLVVNDHWRMAPDLCWDFVHLGQEDLQGTDLGARRRAGIRYGLSTHDLTEFDRTLALDPSYVALGAVYPTRLKQTKSATQGPDRVRELKRSTGAVPPVGIGCLTPKRLPGLFEGGANIAAVITAIQQAADPVARCTEWIVSTRQYGR